MTGTTDIRKLSKEELTAAFAELGEPRFRAGQVYEWLWQKSARSFDEMTNLSKPLREKLKERFSFYSMADPLVQQSADGTLKFGMRPTMSAILPVYPPR